MRSAITFLLVLGLSSCTTTDKRPNAPDSLELERMRLALTTGPEQGLFDRKAHLDEWVKASCSHHLHTDADGIREGIFRFECGFRAFVAFDEAGYPMRFLSY